MAHHGALLALGEIPSGLRRGADLAVLFVCVAVLAELVEERICRRQSVDLFGGEERGQAFLPEVVHAFDFPLGLRCWSIAQRDFVEAQGSPELGECVRLVCEEEGEVIDVEREWQSAGFEGAGKEVEMGQEILALVKPGERQHAAVIVEISSIGRSSLR